MRHLHHLIATVILCFIFVLTVYLIFFTKKLNRLYYINYILILKNIGFFINAQLAKYLIFSFFSMLFKLYNLFTTTSFTVNCLIYTIAILISFRWLMLFILIIAFLKLVHQMFYCRTVNFKKLLIATIVSFLIFLVVMALAGLLYCNIC